MNKLGPDTGPVLAALVLLGLIVVGIIIKPAVALVIAGVLSVIGGLLAFAGGLFGMAFGVGGIISGIALIAFGRLIGLMESLVREARGLRRDIVDRPATIPARAAAPRPSEPAQPPPEEDRW